MFEKYPAKVEAEADVPDSKYSFPAITVKWLLPARDISGYALIEELKPDRNLIPAAAADTK